MDASIRTSRQARIAMFGAGFICMGLAVPAGAEGTAVTQPAPPGVPLRGTVVTPDSSIPKAEDTGRGAHTNTKFFVPQQGRPSAPRPGTNAPPDDGPDRPAPH